MSSIVNSTQPTPIDLSGLSILSSISGNTITITGPVLVSGQLVAVSGIVLAKISGETVYLISGKNEVIVVNQPISVTGNFQVATNISGNTVYLISGKNEVVVVNQPISVTGNFSASTNISGNTVYLTSGKNEVIIANQPVAVTGNIQVASNVSGNTIYLISGNNAVQNSGQTIRVQAFDPSGAVWRDAWMNQSGGNAIRVDAGAINVASNVSGNTIYLVSGKNEVIIANQLQSVAITGTINVASNISGQVVYLTSGKNDVQISGQTVLGDFSGVSIRIMDGSSATLAAVNTDSANDATNPTQNPLLTQALLYGYEAAADRWARARITASGQAVSGITHKLVVGFSGDPVSISGQAISVSGNMVSVSGQPVNVSGNTVTVVGSVIANVSGQVVYLISGNNNVQNSGQVARILPEGQNVTIRTISGVVCTSLSGGTRLPDNSCDRVFIRMDPDQSGRMLVGSQTNPPTSGIGFKLAPGDGIALQCSNFNTIQIFATISGELAYAIAEDT